MLIFERIPGLDELAARREQRDAWRWYGGTVPAEARTVPSVRIVRARPDAVVRPDHGTTDRFNAGCRCVVCVDRQVLIGRVAAVAAQGGGS